MQILILNKPEKLPKLLTGFMETGIHGTTVVDCKGGLQVLGSSTEDAPPIFGSLRQFLNPEYESGKLVMTVLQEEDIAKARQIVHTVVGDISKPGTGVLFTIPVIHVEGLAQ